MNTAPRSPRATVAGVFTAAGGWLAPLALAMAVAAPAGLVAAEAGAVGAAPSRSALLEPVADAASLPVLRTSAEGPDVARAQALLDRAWFSPGEIDGRYGRNVRHAVQAFQRANGLADSGRVDAATWDALGATRAPAFAEVVLGADDVRGPYAALPADVMERAKLKSLGYESVAEAIGERYHSSPRLLRELNPQRRWAAGERWIVPAVGRGDAPAAEGVTVEVDKGRKLLKALDASGRTLAAFPISIGGPSDPLPLGQMKIVNEVDNPSFTFDPKLLKSAPPGSRKTVLSPGPNNPVGSMWLGLTKPHWGIHGTPDPEKLGRQETNGCIHLSNWDVARLSKLVAAGTVVDVRE